MYSHIMYIIIIKLYTLNMCSLLDVNYASITLFYKSKELLQINRGQKDIFL